LETGIELMLSVQPLPAAGVLVDAAVAVGVAVGVGAGPGPGTGGQGQEPGPALLLLGMLVEAGSLPCLAQLEAESLLGDAVVEGEVLLDQSS
jgi:hypothetical protein